MITSSRQHDAGTSRQRATAGPVRNGNVDFASLFAGWDRAAYGIVMRRIEILLVRGYARKALDLFHDFVVTGPYAETATMASPLCDLLPVRVVNSLNGAGYTTLSQLEHAQDADLLRLANFGEKTIENIHQVIADVKAGRKRCGYQGDDLAPDWDLSDALSAPENNLLPFPVSSEENQTMSNQAHDITTALDTLLTAGEEVVSEVDTKIALLESQLANLKRIRRLLAPSQVKAGNAMVAKYDHEKEIDRIVQCLRDYGPLTCGELGERLSLNLQFIGRLVKKSGGRLGRLADGRVDITDRKAA